MTHNTLQGMNGFKGVHFLVDMHMVLDKTIHTEKLYCTFNTHSCTGDVFLPVMW